MVVVIGDVEKAGGDADEDESGESPDRKRSFDPRWGGQRETKETDMVKRCPS